MQGTDGSKMNSKAPIAGPYRGTRFTQKEYALGSSHSNCVIFDLLLINSHSPRKASLTSSQTLGANAWTYVRSEFSRMFSSCRIASLDAIRSAKSDIAQMYTRSTALRLQNQAGQITF